MMKNIKKISMALVAAFLVTGVTAASYASNSKSFKDIKKSKTLIIGTNAEYAPYEYHEVKGGKDEIKGFDIEISNRIAKSIGIKLVIKDMKFDGLLAALKAGSVDMVIASMNPTAERKKSVDFSKIYYSANQVLIVNKKDNNKFKSIKDFKGKKIGVQMGSTCEKVAKNQIKGSTIKSLPKISDEIMQLKSNMVSGVVVDEPVAKIYIKANKDLQINEKIKLKTEETGLAIAVRKGDKEFVKEINKALNSMEKDGTLEGLVKKYITK